MQNVILFLNQDVGMEDGRGSFVAIETEVKKRITWVTKGAKESDEPDLLPPQRDDKNGLMMRRKRALRIEGD